MILSVFKKALLLPLILFITIKVVASPNDEIDHLLHYVATTDCQYERNGSRHNGSEAFAHIKKKHEYFKDEINTAEDFIKYAATKSSFSGKPYKIHCSSQAAVNSKDWLNDELKAYRATRN